MITRLRRTVLPSPIIYTELKVINNSRIDIQFALPTYVGTPIVVVESNRILLVYTKWNFKNLFKVVVWNILRLTFLAPTMSSRLPYWAPILEKNNFFAVSAKYVGQTALWLALFGSDEKGLRLNLPFEQSLLLNKKVFLRL